MQRSICQALVLAILCCLGLAGGNAPAYGQAKVDPSASVGDLLDESGNTDGRAGEGAQLASPLRFGFAVATIMAAVVVLVLVLRRWRPSTRGVRGGPVEVVGRTALSPRHSVFLLRLYDSRIVAVGVSGDRMTTLATLPAPDGARGETECGDASPDVLDDLPSQVTSEATSRFSVPGRDKDDVAGTATEEMGRLRGLLRQWRETVPSARGKE